MIKKGFNTVLSLVVLSGIGFYVVDAQENELATASPNKQVITDAPPKQAYTNGTVNEVITKELIHGRMLNTVDNFETVKGSFTYVTNRTNANGKIEVDYQVKSGKNPKSYQKSVQSDGSVHESKYSDQKAVKIDHNEKDFSMMDVVPPSGRKWDKNPKSRYKDEDGRKLAILRDDPTQMVEAKMSIFPEELALGYLENYDSWDIAEQTQLHDLDVVVIEGIFDNYYKEKKQATTYKLWVHQQTGILLKWEERNDKGELKTSLETHKIKINDSVDESKFSTDVPTLYKDKIKEEVDKRKKKQ